MTSFPGAVRHCLRRLATFRGRDTRSQFWFYVLGLFIVEQAVTAVLVVMLMTTLHGPFANDATSVAPAAFAAWFQGIATAALLSPVVAIALLAAAVTRRLHDRGLSGWWGAMPIPFLLVGTVAMYRFSAGMARSGAFPEPWLFETMLINNALYLLALLALIVLLCLEGTPVPNRFGAPAGEA